MVVECVACYIVVCAYDYEWCCYLHHCLLESQICRVLASCDYCCSCCCVHRIVGISILPEIILSIKIASSPICPRHSSAAQAVRLLYIQGYPWQSRCCQVHQP